MLTTWAVMYETKASRRPLAVCTVTMAASGAGRQAGLGAQACDACLRCFPGQSFPGFKQIWLFGSTLAFEYSWHVLARCCSWGETLTHVPSLLPANLEASRCLLFLGLKALFLLPVFWLCGLLLAFGGPLECLT